MKVESTAATKGGSRPKVRLLALSLALGAGFLGGIGSVSASTGPTIEIDSVNGVPVPSVERVGPAYAYVTGSVTLMLTNPTPAPEGGSVVLTWRKSATACVRGFGGTTVGSATGASPTLTIGGASDFGWYFVDEKVIDSSAGSSETS